MAWPRKPSPTRKPMHHKTQPRATTLTTPSPTSSSNSAWNELETAARQASGLTQVEYRKLPSKDRALLREKVRGDISSDYTWRSSGQWVYVLTHPLFPGYVKVGQTNNLDKRLSQYQTGCPASLYRMHSATWSDNASAFAFGVYDRLESFRCSGEWFQVDVEHVLKAISANVGTIVNED